MREWSAHYASVPFDGVSQQDVPGSGSVGSGANARFSRIKVVVYFTLLKRLKHSMLIITTLQATSRNQVFCTRLTLYDLALSTLHHRVSVAIRIIL